MWASGSPGCPGSGRARRAASRWPDCWGSRLRANNQFNLSKGGGAGREVRMTPELLMLALSVVLGFVHIIVSAIATTHQCGLKWNLSARDAPMPPPQVIAGRVQRALHNFLDTFPLFAA